MLKKEISYLILSVVSDESLCVSRAPVVFRPLHENVRIVFCPRCWCTLARRIMGGSHKLTCPVKTCRSDDGALRVRLRCSLVLRLQERFHISVSLV